MTRTTRPDSASPTTPPAPSPPSPSRHPSTSPTTCSSRSASSTGWRPSPPRSARCGSPGTGAASPRWSCGPTAPRRSPATRPAPAAGRILADALPAHLADAVARRLAGERRVRIPLDLRGRTEFEVAVWTKALEIPRGEVRPYGWIAAEIGRPKAVRAVGTALGHNPVPLIVPCHRVVRTDGTIGQYSLGGPGNKRTILAAEGLDPDALEDAARRGERLSGSTTTRIVCWPTCRHARRIQDRYRVAFRSLREAGEPGYRPVQGLPPDGDRGRGVGRLATVRRGGRPAAATVPQLGLAD